MQDSNLPQRSNMKIENKYRGLTPLAAAISLALAAPIAFAEEETVKEKENDIERIVVTSKFQQSLINRIPVKPKELPFTLNVVDSDLLDARNFAVRLKRLPHYLTSSVLKIDAVQVEQGFYHEVLQRRF